MKECFWEGIITKFLLLLQLFDSQLPVGSFSYSWGLETYATYQISKSELKELIQVNLLQGSLGLDLAFCALTYQVLKNKVSLSSLIEEVSSFKFLPPSFETSTRLGKNFLRLCERLFDFKDVPEELRRTPHKCIVVGWIGWKLKLSLKLLLLSYAHSEIKALLSAAIRCIKISPEDTEKILLSLKEEITQKVDSLLKSPEKNLYSSTPLFDIRFYQQKFLFTRLFEG